ncbi:MAG: CoA-binding protein, partial [Desulfuromusa sp.]|nr:CoA-binding protein [Desulfuromusa sp.]
MDQIEQFMQSPAFAVAGASTNRAKYGNKVLRCYKQNNHPVTPVNPRAHEIEGLACVNSVLELPDNVDSLSIITPPKITEQVVQHAITKGIKNIWMQPG